MHSSFLIVFLCCCFGRLALAYDDCGDGTFCYSGGSGGIAGVVVSSLVMVIVVVVIVLCCRRYRQPAFVRTGVVNPGVTVIASGQQMGSFPHSPPLRPVPRGNPPSIPGNQGSTHHPATVHTVKRLRKVDNSSVMKKQMITDMWK